MTIETVKEMILENVRRRKVMDESKIMINDTILKDYDFNSMIELYDYIIESRCNGQFKQVKTLVRNLSYDQYEDFITYLHENNIIVDKHYIR